MLRVLFTPGCWLQQNFYSAEWDAELRQHIQSNRPFLLICEYTAKIGGRDVWISNHPYASFSLMITKGNYYRLTGFRPKRITMLEAHDKLMSDTLLLKQEMEGAS